MTWSSPASAAGTPSTLFAQVRRLGLEQRVRFTDYVADADLPALYSLADVFVFPLSCYEGFGLPPLEAMACGTPVVSSNAASLPEAVGDAGLLVPPDDPGASVAALRRLLGMPSCGRGCVPPGWPRRNGSREATALQTLAGHSGAASMKSSRPTCRRRCMVAVAWAAIRSVLAEALIALGGDEYSVFYNRPADAHAPLLDRLPRVPLALGDKPWRGVWLWRTRCANHKDRLLSGADLFHALDHLLPYLTRTPSVFHPLRPDLPVAARHP